jgi:poly-beta-1,6-N-acetyl-D-glucosamine synthase
MMLLPDWIHFLVIGLLGFTFLIQLYYLLFEFSGVGFSGEKKPASGKLPPVSVVICARNELKNLKAFLPFVLDQDYPEYQVVVVNDCSWDESAKYLEEMEDAYKVLKVVTLREQEKYQHGKKFALTLGIKGAAFDHLLFTDADCKPQGKLWIKSMMESLTEGKELLLSYGAYFKEPGFLNKWIRFDTAQNAMLYLSRAQKGKAYMGVGRNMGYVRSLFFKNKGFASHYHLMSGDDDLFVNETSSHTNTAVSLNPASFTFSKPKTSLGTWIWQKKRHMSTGKYYRVRDKSLIGLFFGSQFVFWLSVIAACLMKLNPEIIVTIVSTRLAAQMLIYWKGFKKLGETDLVFLVPVFDLIVAITYPLLAISNFFVKTKSWK